MTIIRAVSSSPVAHMADIASRASVYFCYSVLPFLGQVILLLSASVSVRKLINMSHSIVLKTK